MDPDRRPPGPPDPPPAIHDALFRALAEASSAITFIYQGERNVYANPAAERATGYSREELLEKKFWDIIHPDSRELIRLRGLARQRGEAVPPNYVVQILTRSGASRWLDFTGTAVELNGQPAVLGTAVDVTEEVAVREALRESQANYRRLFDNALVGVLQTTRAGEVLVANQAALRIFGCQSLDELRGLGIRSRYQDPRQRELLLDRLLREGHVQQLELGMLTAGGAPVQVEISVVMEGELLSGVLVDVTERRRLEREALRAQRLESLAILAGGLAHDFNNLLSAVLGNVSLARHHAPGEAASREWLLEAELACQRARGLTQQLLAFARGAPPVARVVEARRLLEEAVGFGLRGSSVACVWELPPELPLIEVDEGQIAQVVHNLVLNAVQAMPGGGRLTVRAEVLGPRRALRVAFTDTGPGIPLADQARIFDPYYTTKPGGVGLGLASALSIVQRHGGALRVESHPPQGACFLLELPLAADQAARPAEPAGPSGLRGAGRVLIMDDEEPVRRTLGAILRELGYEPALARDGEEAARAFSAARQAGQPFDVALLDLTIRGGPGGLETFQRLRGLDPGLRAILVSGYASQPTLGEARALGFRGRLQKPFTLTELATCVRDALHDGSQIRVPGT